MTDATLNTRLDSADVYLAGRRSYELRAGGTVASIRRRGVVRTRYDIELEGRRMTALLRWSGELDVIDAAGNEVAHTTNLVNRRVTAQIAGQPPLELSRWSWGGQWTAATADHGGTLRFAPHPGWQGRPVVTITTLRPATAAGPAAEAADTAETASTVLTMIVGTCLVLAYRALTGGLVRGTSPGWRQAA